MIRMLSAACVAAGFAATLAACSTVPAHLAAPADVRSPHRALAPATVLAGAGREEVAEAGEWQDLNRRVAPTGGAHAR